MEFFRHGGAADYAAPLQHRDLEARLGEVGSAHQAVVAAADD